MPSVGIGENANIPSAISGISSKILYFRNLYLKEGILGNNRRQALVSPSMFFHIDVITITLFV